MNLCRSFLADEDGFKQSGVYWLDGDFSLAFGILLRPFRFSVQVQGLETCHRGLPISGISVVPAAVPIVEEKGASIREERRRNNTDICYS